MRPPALDKAPVPEDAGPMGLRRLTWPEYRNTVADLLKLPPEMSSTFPADIASPTPFHAPDSQWFRYFLGRMDDTADLGSIERAYRAGAAVPGYSIRDMLTTAVQTRTFRYRALSAGEM